MLITTGTTSSNSGTPTKFQYAKDASEPAAPTHFWLGKGWLESEEAFLIENYSLMELAGEESQLVQESTR